MPFDKGKKRKLIDQCGHEKCYSCAHTTHQCTICSLQAPTKKLQQSRFGTSPNRMGRSKLITNGTLSTYCRDPSLPMGRRPSRVASLSRGSSPCRPDNTILSASRPSLRDNPRCTFTSQPRDYLKMKTSAKKCVSGSYEDHNQLPNKPNSTNSMKQKIVSAFRNSPISPKLKRPPLKPKTVNTAPHSPASEKSAKAASKQEFHRQGTENIYAKIGSFLCKNSSSSISRRASSRLASNSICSASYSSLSAESSELSCSSYKSGSVQTITGSSDMECRPSESFYNMNFPSSLGSAEELRSRRHSLTTCNFGMTEEDSGLKRNSVRLSHRYFNMRGPINPKVRFASYRNDVNLRPLFFEVPQQDPDMLYVGRSWVFSEIEKIIRSDSTGERGIAVTGYVGTGKTSLILQLVEHSCFGRKQDLIYQDPYELSSSSSKLSLIPDGVKAISNHVIAYHFCQSENAVTCLIPDFVHSIAAQLFQSPRLQAYRELLLSDATLQGYLSLGSCIIDPSNAFVKGILNPLIVLRRTGKIGTDPLLILLDGLCEAEYHKMENGQSLGTFIASHCVRFPSFLKLIVTARTSFANILPADHFSHVSLNLSSENAAADNIVRDLTDFSTFRCSHSPTIRQNVASALGKSESCSLLEKFIHHIVSLCRGSMLYLKLLLDLVERGHLIPKSRSFKLLPQSLNELFMLLFNLKFPSVKSFEKVQPILNICLAAIKPLSIIDIFKCVNSGLIYDFLSWEEFLSRFKMLNFFLVKRTDESYMLFHPALRQWLLNRKNSESSEFLCDVRQGHACIALKMSRMQWPLENEELLELSHHIIKAHIYRNQTQSPSTPSRDMMALWLAQSAGNLSKALCHIRNLYNPNSKVSRLLLLAGASADSDTEILHKPSILSLCAQQGHSEMVALLLEFHADVNSVNMKGETPLILASAEGHETIVHKLVHSGASVDSVDSSGEGALGAAAKNGHLGVVSFLLSCDWSSSILSQHLIQSLVLAAGQGHLNVVEFSLGMASVKIDDEDSATGETALTMAATNGQLHIVSYLLNNGASLSKTNERGDAAIICSVRNGHYEVTKCLLQKRIDIETTDISGRTPIMIAAAEGHIGLVELLFDKGASVDRVDREGLTPLSWACLNGHIHAVQFIMESKANINHMDKTGRSSIHLAAFQGDPAIVQYLLENGANFEQLDVNGMRPLDHAVRARKSDAVQCFLRKGAKLGPSTWAMATGKPNIMAMLLTKLLDDSVVLCKKGKLQDAAHRCSYALRKIPSGNMDEYSHTFFKIRFHLTLNLSRCKRKLKEFEEAIQCANAAIELKPDSYEGFYARSMAKRECNRTQEALQDLITSLGLVPAEAKEARRVMQRLRSELVQEMQSLQLEDIWHTHNENLAPEEVQCFKSLGNCTDSMTGNAVMTSSIFTESGYGSTA